MHILLSLDPPSLPSHPPQFSDKHLLKSVPLGSSQFSLEMLRPMPGSSTHMPVSPASQSIGYFIFMRGLRMHLGLEGSLETHTVSLQVFCLNIIRMYKGKAGFQVMSKQKWNKKRISGPTEATVCNFLSIPRFGIPLSHRSSHSKWVFFPRLLGAGVLFSILWLCTAGFGSENV